MVKRAHESRVCGARKKRMISASTPRGNSLSLVALEHVGQGFYLESEIQQRSAQTLYFRRCALARLLAFCRDKGFEACGPDEVKQFLASVSAGKPGADGKQKPVRPRTVQAYFVELRSLFAYGVREGSLEENPLQGIQPPQVRADQIHPFTREQTQALLQAAGKSSSPKRDRAVALFLLDTGARVSEVCGLHVSDLDLQSKSCEVLGKGNKRRVVFFSPTTARAIWQYLQERPHEAEDTLFLGERGHTPGAGMTRSGLLTLIRRLGKAAGLSAVRCSPHTFRHTFAVEFLRNGGDTFSLQRLLGHTNLAMTNRYVSLARADLESQHRRCSPVEGMTRKGGK